MLKKLQLLLPLLPKLGYSNVAYMVWYRLSMKMGWRKGMLPIGKSVEGPFYKAVSPIDNYTLKSGVIKHWKEQIGYWRVN